MFIDLDAKEPLKLLADLSGKLENTKPLMGNIAGAMMNAVEKNFAEEGRPDWVDLTEKTKERRKSGKILQISGQLAASVNARYDSDKAAVGTNHITAATHQFGAKEGEYGSTKTGLPIPFGDIPARPFLKLGEDDIQEIDGIIGDFLDV